MGSGNRVPPSRDSPSPPSRAPSTIFFWPRSRVTPAGPGACKWEERARVGTGAPGCSEQPVQWEHPKGCPGNGRLPGQRAGLAGAGRRVGPSLRPEGSGTPPPPPPDPNLGRMHSWIPPCTFGRARAWRCRRSCAVLPHPSPFQRCAPRRFDPRFSVHPNWGAPCPVSPLGHPLFCSQVPGTCDLGFPQSVALDPPVQAPPPPSHAAINPRGWIGKGLGGVPAVPLPVWRLPACTPASGEPTGLAPPRPARTPPRTRALSGVLKSRPRG